MHMVAAPIQRSLQQLLHPILVADRQIQDLYHCLDALIDVEDFLEERDAPAALAPVRQTIRFLRTSCGP